MRKIIFCLMFTVFVGSAFAQNSSKQSVIKRTFGKEFVKMIDRGENNTIYLVDMTKLTSKFERVYFMNLVYNDNKIISMDSDINKDQLSFGAANKYPFQEIEKLFLDLKDQTAQASKNLSSKEKEKAVNQNKVK